MTDLIDKILDLARWAPSGDNTQNWRFEKINETYFLVHGHDTRDWCVYDLDGHASQIALGALLQTIELAATNWGYQAKITRRQNEPDTNPVFDVELIHSPDQKPSELIPFIEERVTQRRPFSTKPLTTEQKQQLEASAGEKYQIVWLEGRKKRWQMAKLLFKSAWIRLTIPEAYEVHKRTIEWDSQFSKTKIPDQAVGADTFTLKIMRWALQSWQRVTFMNKYCLGTWPPRLQMDLLPGYQCAAHFLLLSRQSLQTTDDYIEGGKALQRFWLTATQLGLQFQPEMTPLIFSRYVGSPNKIQFCDLKPAHQRAEKVMQMLLSIFANKPVINKGVFLGRMGSGKTPISRSLRLDNDALIQKNENKAAQSAK